MYSYELMTILDSDKRSRRLMDELLTAEGIARDANLDYSCGLFDEEYRLVATGSCFANTLRCLAVDHRYQGEGLLNRIVTHLMEVQFERGNHHLFLYTKCDTARFFCDLGFYEVARVQNQVVFLENRRDGFLSYLQALQQETPDHLANQAKRVAALVVNANPFTLGHQYLIEKVAAENDIVHLFIVSEDASLVPFAVREQLVKAGTAHLSNIVYHRTGSYLISSSTFPSYFLKDDVLVNRAHAQLDLAVFKRIAQALGITRRYVGEEPTSQVTGIYNQVMQEELPLAGIECIVIPRKEFGGKAISASTVRSLLKQGRLEEAHSLIPDTTYNFFASAQAQPVLERILSSEDVIHY